MSNTAAMSYQTSNVRTFRPASATPIKEIQHEIATLVSRWVGEINNAIAVNVKVIQEVQWTAVYLDTGWKQQMSVTCIKSPVT